MTSEKDSTNARPRIWEGNFLLVSNGQQQTLPTQLGKILDGVPRASGTAVLAKDVGKCENSYISLAKGRCRLRRTTCEHGDASELISQAPTTFFSSFLQVFLLIFDSLCLN